VCPALARLRERGRNRQKRGSDESCQITPLPGHGPVPGQDPGYCRRCGRPRRRGDGLVFWWNQNGTNTWRGEPVAANGTTFSAPSIAADGNGVIIAAEGVNHSLDFYWQTDGSSTWSPAEVVAGANSTYSAPVLADIGNGVGIVAQGPQNSLDYYWAANGTSTWYPELVGGYNTTYAAPDIAPDGNSAIVAAEGPSNSLDFYWQQDGTTPWNPESVAGAGTTSSAPAITGNDNSANIAAQGPNESTDFYWQTNGTTPWNPGTIPDDVGASTPSITTMNHGSGDGVCVTQILLVECTVNGSGTWQPAAQLDQRLYFTGSDSSISEHNGGDILAVYSLTGYLTFFWDNNGGTLTLETVDSVLY
jgi:hypothetical protein